LSVEQAHGRFDRLLRGLKYKIGDKYYCAVKGMLTDYSSTPTIYDLIVKTFKVRMAGVVHDSLYQTAIDCGGYNVTRKEADYVWRVIAQTGEDSANTVQAWLGWSALRAGGWVVWNKYRKSQQK